MTNSKQITTGPTKRPYKEDEQYLEEVEAAIEDDDIDKYGGVSAEHLVRRMGINEDTAWCRLKELAEQGDLVAVQGISSDGRPRKSYVPSDE